MIHRPALSSGWFSLFSFSVIAKDIYNNIWKTNKIYPSPLLIILYYLSEKNVFLHRLWCMWGSFFSVLSACNCVCARLNVCFWFQSWHLSLNHSLIPALSTNRLERRVLPRQTWAECLTLFCTKPGFKNSLIHTLETLGHHIFIFWFILTNTSYHGFV